MIDFLHLWHAKHASWKVFSRALIAWPETGSLQIGQTSSPWTVGAGAFGAGAGAGAGGAGAGAVALAAGATTSAIDGVKLWSDFETTTC